MVNGNSDINNIEVNHKYKKHSVTHMLTTSASSMYQACEINELSTGAILTTWNLTQAQSPTTSKDL